MPQLGFVWYFSHAYTGVIYLVEEDGKDKVSYQEYIPLVWLTIVDVELDNLAEVVFVRFLHCKVIFFFPSHTVVFGMKSLLVTDWGVIYSRPAQLTEQGHVIWYILACVHIYIHKYVICNHMYLS